jgi:hypothetical protein
MQLNYCKNSAMLDPEVPGFVEDAVLDASELGFFDDRAQEFMPRR